MKRKKLFFHERILFLLEPKLWRSGQLILTLDLFLRYHLEFEPKEALRQFHEWFPNGIADTPASELQTYYDKIALAIANNAEHGQSVIEEFRKNITSQKEIRSGNHFNLQHLIAAYRAYITHFEALGNGPNRDLFWNQVIGYVQRQMTTYNAQIHCSGVQSVLDDEESFSRTLEFDTGQKFFPLQESGGLGFDFGCYSYHGDVTGCGGATGGDGWSAGGEGWRGRS